MFFIFTVCLSFIDIPLFLTEYDLQNRFGNVLSVNRFSFEYENKNTVIINTHNITSMLTSGLSTMNRVRNFIGGLTTQCLNTYLPVRIRETESAESKNRTLVDWFAAAECRTCTDICDARITGEKHCVGWKSFGRHKSYKAKSLSTVVPETNNNIEFLFWFIS